MITTDAQTRIVDAIALFRKQFNSDSKCAVALQISPAQFSRIMKNDWDQVISEANWISIARRLNVQLSNSAAWKTAQTPVYSYITNQLKVCQENSMGGLLCDNTDIGKTYTARCYVREHKHAIYIDCSQVKTKRMLVMAIAREFGISSTGSYRDIYADLVFYLKSIETPLIILDEAGDLNYEAFLELKALYNATDQFCGWYMMGADGLRKKLERNRERNKVGYQEIFSRYGSRYQRITPEGRESSREFKNLQATLIAKANDADQEILETIKRASEGTSLRRIFIDITKKRRAA